MKITEIRERSKEGTLILADINIERYIGLATKMVMIEGFNYTDDNGVELHAKGIVERVLEEVDGVLKLNRYVYELNVMYEALKNYTDIDFEDSEFTMADYDMFITNGIWSFVSGNSDFNVFYRLLDEAIAQKINGYNSLSSAIRQSVDKLLTTLNDLTDDKKMDNMLKTLNKAMKRNPELKECFSDFKDLKNAGVKL